MAEPRLSLDDVTKTYTTPGQRTRVLRSVSLRVDAGEIVWINGPSGSGKSSVINIAGLLTEPSSGTVTLDGRDVTRAPDDVRTALRSAQIGMIFQSNNLFPELTAIENVLVAARRAGEQERASELLDSLGLGRERARRAKKLSGGQQQRVAIARALLNGPRLLLADEPISGVDAANASAILHAIASAAAQGCAVLVSSHDPAVGRIAHRTIQLELGAVVAA